MFRRAEKRSAGVHPFATLHWHDSSTPNYHRSARAFTMDGSWGEEGWAVNFCAANAIYTTSLGACL